MKPWLIFIPRLFGCEPLYKSEELTFLAFDEEHHRVAIANTSGVFQNLGFIPKTIMRIKNWMNRTLPSIVGLDHISYKLNPIEKWFEFYHKAKEKDWNLIGRSIMAGLQACITKIQMEI